MAVYQIRKRTHLSGGCKSRRRACASCWQEDKKEYLFDGDPKYWKRHSPILFPFVGGVKTKSTAIMERLIQ